jgi:hypothetical protein
VPGGPWRKLKERRARRRREYVESDAERRQAQQERYDAERRMAEQRQKIDAGGPSGFF